MKPRQIFVALAVVLPFTLTTVVAQTQLNQNEILGSLQGVSDSSIGMTAASLRQTALENIRKNPGQNALNRPLLFPQLEDQAQFTIEIVFDFNSAAIRPESYRAVGSMADALHHPILLGYRFLVIGHTDAVGGREYNLNLSQRRAEAIRNALVDPFGVNPARLEAVGLGEEQLRDPLHPDSQINRRVQLINIGR
jgi:outer membrane protein OmpA-like peptidoglycan-associated protein